MKKLTKEEFVNREPDLLNGEYEFIGKYLNSRTKTLFKHDICGYEWEITPSNFQRGQRCPRCAGVERFNKISFCGREDDIVSGEYEMIGEYRSTLTKTMFRHNVCGYKWKTNPNTFHLGSRCPKCSILIRGGKRRFTKEEFINREEDILSGEYEILGEYINNNTKTLFKHNVCGYEWKSRPFGFHAGRRCPECGGTKKLTKEEFCEREKDIQTGEYTILGKYEDVRTKVLFKHNICGHEWKIVPFSFHAGCRCPRCGESKGEKMILKVLEEINIPFESQKRFDSCRYKKPLPFDFYVNDSFLVEYDGEQHFRVTSVFGGDKELKLRQLRDNIKTKWAKDNGIPLVRIPYTQFDNIEQIIKDSVDKYCGKSDGSKIIV